MVQHPTKKRGLRGGRSQKAKFVRMAAERGITPEEARRLYWLRKGVDMTLSQRCASVQLQGV
jgi:hypothetical protein